MAKLCEQSITTIYLLFLVVGLAFAAGCESPEERAQSHYERGVELIEQKDYVRAALEIKNALQLKDDMVPAWLALSQIEEHNQNWQAVVGILRKVVSLDTQNLQARIRFTRLLILGGKVEEALKQVNAAAEIDASNAEVLALRAAILFKLNDAPGALADAEAALEADPANAEALIVIAAYRLARGDAEGALLLLDRDPEQHARDLGIQLFKMKILAESGDIKRVETLLKKLIDHYPEEPAFRKQLVVFYVQQKRIDDAEREMRAIAADAPGNIEAGLDVVRFLHTYRSPNAARQELIARINAGGNVFPYQMALADFHYSQGSANDSIQLLTSVAKEASTPEQAVAARLRLAEIQLAEKNVAAAESLVADVLAADERNVDALRLRASMRITKGELDTAISDIREALNEQPKAPRLLQLLASAYERTGAIELADDSFAEAIKASKFDPQIGLGYASFLRRRGNAARSEDLLIELAGRWPRHAGVLSALAQIRLERQDWVGAQEVAESLRRLKADGGVGDQILGAALSGQKKFDQSIAVLQRAYEATPTAVQPMVSLVRAYMRAQQFEEAESFLRAVLTASPSNAEALVLLGSLQLKRGATEEAKASFRSAIEKQPTSVAGYRALADFHTRQREYDQAMKVTREGIAQQSNDFALRLGLASLLEVQGDFDGAIAEYEAILKDQPASLIAANNLASLLADHRTDEASLDRAATVAAILKKTQIPQFKDTLGWIHYRRGEFREAATLLEEAAHELPNLALVHYHLGMTYVALEDLPRGMASLKKSLELVPASGGVSESQIKDALKKAEAS